jgi:hypothetical protein
MNAYFSSNAAPRYGDAGSPAQSGSAILGVVALMLVVSTLGVTLLTHLSGSSEGTLVTDGGNRAFFLAESGARYAIARILQQGETAAADLDGRRYTLTRGDAFDLAVEVEHVSGVTRYCIDSTGISGLGTPLARRYLNGYIVELSGTPAVTSPIAFPYAAHITGTTPVSLTGSSYIDSYDSSDPATAWTTRGQYNDAAVRIDLDRNAASLAWSTAIYGDLLVGAGADTSSPTSIVNRPANIRGDEGIVPSPAVSVSVVPPPSEAAEVPAPSPLTAMPAFTSWGTPTLPAGNYQVASDLSTGSAQLTLGGPTYVAVGDDLEIVSGGTISVNGNFAGRINDDMNVGGGTHGLTVRGSCDLWVMDALTIDNGSSMNIHDALDLDVGGNLRISGGASLVLGGDADIDVAGSFRLTGGAALRIDGAVILRVGAGFQVDGNSRITFGPSGSLQVYVQSGSIAIDSVNISADGTASRFTVVGAAAVSNVELSGTSSVYAAIYAPAARVVLSGSAQLFGAVVARSLELSGTAALHYDYALAGAAGNPTTDSTDILRRFWVAAGG